MAENSSLGGLFQNGERIPESVRAQIMAAQLMQQAAAQANQPYTSKGVNALKGLSGLFGGLMEGSSIRGEHNAQAAHRTALATLLAQPQAGYPGTTGGTGSGAAPASTPTAAEARLRSCRCRRRARSRDPHHLWRGRRRTCDRSGRRRGGAEEPTGKRPIRQRHVERHHGAEAVLALECG